ncbi:hypothetical protein B5X24_HaOG212623 [Helicoverpa armigera]|nr:hypothetical protein B5X24_HaOG212623 [Helicoverpa armigera]
MILRLRDLARSLTYPVPQFTRDQTIERFRSALADSFAQLPLPASDNVQSTRPTISILFIILVARRLRS